MARYVKHTKTGPIAFKIKEGDKVVSICGCGLTSNDDGTCDGSHHKVKDENTESSYSYDKDLNKKRVGIVEICEKCGKEDCECDDHQCACGGNCGCNH